MAEMTKLRQQVADLRLAIERCGASPQLTEASDKAGELYVEISKLEEADADAVAVVAAHLGKIQELEDSAEKFQQAWKKLCRRVDDAEDRTVYLNERVALTVAGNEGTHRRLQMMIRKVTALHRLLEEKEVPLDEIRGVLRRVEKRYGAEDTGFFTTVRHVTKKKRLEWISADGKMWIRGVKDGFVVKGSDGKKVKWKMGEVRVAVKAPEPEIAIAGGPDEPKEK